MKPIAPRVDWHQHPEAALADHIAPIYRLYRRLLAPGCPRDARAVLDARRGQPHKRGVRRV